MRRLITFILFVLLISTVASCQDPEELECIDLAIAPTDRVAVIIAGDYKNEVLNPYVDGPCAEYTDLCDGVRKYVCHPKLKIK